MNTIYIRKKDRQLVHSNLVLAKCCEEKKSHIIPFFKRDVRIKNILDVMFPKVISPIIFNYSITKFDVEYYFTDGDRFDDRSVYWMNIWIEELMFEIDIQFIERLPLLETNQTIQQSNYILNMYSDTYSFNVFNKFMLKHYGKKRYFDNFVICDEDVHVDLAPKQLKYSIIILKMITDIIMYSD